MEGPGHDISVAEHISAAEHDISVTNNNISVAEHDISIANMHAQHACATCTRNFATCMRNMRAQHAWTQYLKVARHAARAYHAYVSRAISHVRDGGVMMMIRGNSQIDGD